MRPSLLLRARRFYEELDYARHMPKAYVERMRRHEPLRVFDNRFGAPKLTIWKLPPTDHVDTKERPWEGETAGAWFERAMRHRQHWYNSKFFKTNYRDYRPLADAEWTIFPGDTVEVLVGRDKHQHGIVSHVIRDQNAVFVDGLHTKLEKVENPMAKSRKLPEVHQPKMQPLDPTKGQVKLVDPNNNEACDVKWIESPEADGGWVRVSLRTGYTIPLPSQAFVTYEYVSKADYIESSKDTPSKAVLRATYEPDRCLKTFEQEILNDFGIKEERVPKPTYWF
ncbi:KOW domain-containing protein [Aphelenchoides fujianensis]|nr:KOW domain-containing protein [Aphelenchoides fujianensis]